MPPSVATTKDNRKSLLAVLAPILALSVASRCRNHMSTFLNLAMVEHPRFSDGILVLSIILSEA